MAIVTLLIVGGVIWRITTPLTVTSGSDLAYIASDVTASPDTRDFCGVPVGNRDGAEWSCRGGKAALFWTRMDLEAYLYGVQEESAGDHAVVLGPYWVWVPGDSDDAETAAKRLRWHGGRLHAGRRLPEGHRWRPPGSSVVSRPTASESSEPTTRSEYAESEGDSSSATTGGGEGPYVEPETTSTSTYELTLDDQQQLTALQTSWSKLPSTQQSDLCSLYDSDIDAVVDPMTANGNFDEEAVVSFLVIACA